MITTPSVCLYFVNTAHPELFKTAVRLYPQGGIREAIRGKTSGPFPTLGTFQWTSAVRAMALLMLRHKASDAGQCCDEASLCGSGGSLASSLDFAVSKRPTWVFDVFGADAAGNSAAVRVFKRTNPNRKRSGPVIVAINERLVPPSSVRVYLDGVELTTREALDSITRHLEGWAAGGREHLDCAA